MPIWRMPPQPQQAVRHYPVYTVDANIGNSPPGTYGFGLLVENDTPSTGLDYFTITNNSGFPVNITISSTDMTGGITWALDDNGNPGDSIVALKAGLEGGDYTVVVKKTPPYNPLKTGLGNGATQKWGLKLYAPTVFQDGEPKQGTVTIIAVAS